MSAPDNDEMLEAYSRELGMSEEDVVQFCKNVLQHHGYSVVPDPPGEVEDDRIPRNVVDAIRRTLEKE